MRYALYQLFVVVIVLWTAGAAGLIVYELVEVPKHAAQHAGDLERVGIDTKTFVDTFLFFSVLIKGLIWGVGVAAFGMIALLLKPSPRQRDRREPHF